MTVRWLWPVIVASTGCDLVFELTEPPVDAPAIDAPPLDDCPPRRADVDEDDDGFMDADDNCPGSANTGQSDFDLDGIGDACDPDLNMPGEKMCFWGFNDPGELAYFETLSEDWEIAGGRLQVNVAKARDGVATRASFDGALLMLRANGLTEATVFATRVGAIVSGTDLTTDTQFGIGCSMEHRAAQDPQLQLFRLPLMPGEFAAMDVVATQELINVTLRASDATTGKPACQGSHGSEPEIVLDLPNSGPQRGQAAVFVENGTVQINSITVVSRP